MSDEMEYLTELHNYVICCQGVRQDNMCSKRQNICFKITTRIENHAEKLKTGVTLKLREQRT